jgi:Kdo2-lipid IVA lauroyltransferase/acyltransferase
MKDWLLLLFIHSLKFLPLKLVRLLGALIGYIGFKTSKRSATRLKNNLLITEMAHLKTVDKMALATAKETGKTLVESLAITWQHPKKHTAGLIKKAINFDLVLKAADEKKPILFLTPHLGNFEIALKYTAYHLSATKFTVLYKPTKEEWLDKLMFTGRSEDNIIPVPTNRTGVAGLLKALRNNEAIGVLPDHVSSGNDGVWVKFFNQDVYATSLAAKLVHFENAVTFLAYSIRTSTGFIVEYIPYVPTTKDIATTVQELYQEFEKTIIKYPTQYYWSYDRFRRRKDQ